MAWYIAALPATEPTSDSRSRRLGIVSLSFGMAGLVPRDARLGAFALQQIRTGFRVRQRYLSRYQAANLLIDGRQPARSMSSRRALWSASEVATRFPASMPQSKTEAARPPFLFATRYRPLPQPPRRVREQGVDQPGLRGEVAAQCLRSAILARDLVEQTFELGDIAVDRLLEGAVGAVFARDFVERLLPGWGVQPLGERLALAALVTVPHFAREVAIHQPADVERQRFQRIDRRLRCTATGRLSDACVGAVEQVGPPSVLTASACRRDRRDIGAARCRRRACVPRCGPRCAPRCGRWLRLPSRALPGAVRWRDPASRHRGRGHDGRRSGSVRRAPRSGRRSPCASVRCCRPPPAASRARRGAARCGSPRVPGAFRPPSASWPAPSSRTYRSTA